MNSIEDIRNGVRAMRGKWQQLAIEADLSYWWVMKFAQGRIKEPGAAKFDRLRAVVIAHRIQSRNKEAA